MIHSSTSNYYLFSDTGLKEIWKGGRRIRLRRKWLISEGPLKGRRYCLVQIPSEEMSGIKGGHSCRGPSPVSPGSWGEFTPEAMGDCLHLSYASLGSHYTTLLNEKLPSSPSH